VAGIGATSTRESIELAREAALAGADFVIAISPGYYSGALLADMTSIKNYFVDIAAASPIPVYARSSSEVAERYGTNCFKV
jgi:L-threo-3-deoxy-hexylosonate aldolase